MKYFSAGIGLILVVLLISTCGRTTIRRYPVSSCRVEQVVEGTRVKCTDGTEAWIQDGKDAAPCSVVPTNAGAQIQCPDGTVADIYHGESITGPVGPAGPEGPSGPAGSSCTVAPTSGGVLVMCEDGRSELVKHGTDGQDGADAELEFVDPCGDNPGQFDEVLIRVSSGELFAYFEQKSNRFLAKLEPGNYVTTDKQKCKFTVTSDLEVVYP